MRRAPILLAAATLFGCATSSHAANHPALVELLAEKGVITEAEAEDQKLLRLLVKKGVITEAEAAKVADGGAPARQAAKTERAAGEAPPGPRDDASTQKPGLNLSAKGEETVDLRFSGRVQAQYDHLAMEDDGVDRPTANHFYFRRLFLGAKAELENGFFAETVLDFAGDQGADVAFDKAYVAYGFEGGPNLRVGHVKVPFGFEETSSSAGLPTIERSAANRFFANDLDFSARHTGLHADGELPGGFNYAGAVVNAAQGEGSRLLGRSNASNDIAVFARVQRSGDHLTAGADAGHQPNNASADSIGNTLEKDVTGITGYLNYNRGGFDALAEYFHGDLGDAGDADGYALRLAYRANRFEPVLRYSRLENDRVEIDADELIRRAPSGGAVRGTDNAINAYYVGLNYYPTPALTFMAGYERADAESDSSGETAEVDGVRTRVQLLW